MSARRRDVLAGALALVPLPARAAGTVVAITGARIHTGHGQRIDDGVLVFEGDRIAAVGMARDVAVPPAAVKIDGRGLWATPGLFDAESLTGLVDVNIEPTARDVGLDDSHDPVRAAFIVTDGLNPRAVALPVTRNEGVTAAALAPHGGLVAGRGGVVRLTGDSLEGMILRVPSAIYANMSLAGRAGGFGTRGGQWLRLRELLDDVRVYARRRDDFERNQMRDLSASRRDLEALVPVVERSLALVIEAHRASDIETTLRFAQEQSINLILTGVEEGWMVADAIAAAKVPAIVSATPNLPRAFEALGARLENAARLAAAGVQVALSPRETEDHLSRTLRFEAGNAVANGLAWEAALAAVSSVPATIFGVGDQVGSLVAGRLADVVLWSGDPFEPLTRPRFVFMSGKTVPMASRQTMLRDRYLRLGR